jgi:hypothetical protein
VRRTRALPFLLACALAPAPLTAQLVTPKTVPVHQSDQFAIFPSDRVGMAGVAVAVDDTLADPFVNNPAKATRLRQPVLFATPYFHAISENRGGGRTLPLGGAGSFGRWSAAGLVALQQLDRPSARWGARTSERNATNRYAAGVLARRFDGGVSVGVSALHAGLGAVDGVDLLYAGSDRIRQDGGLTDLRLGATKQWAGGRVLDVVALHNRTDMTHDVHFTTWRWDPVARRASMTERDEHNVDRTHIWGAHTQLVQPVGTNGWRVGGLATFNRLSHPKIPNYVIMNIPRDPGTTFGYNVGVAAGRVVGPTTFGVDVTYEPMTSETWADAATDTTGPGGLIRAGGRTVENRFRFDNMRLRVGAGRDYAIGGDRKSAIGYQVGLAAYAIDYRLRQWNRVQGSYRVQDEDWMEWTPTLALRIRARDLDVRYAYRATCGNGNSCLSGGRADDGLVFAPNAGGDLGTGGVIAAPSAPLTFDGGRASAHQLTIVVPIR